MRESDSKLSDVIVNRPNTCIKTAIRFVLYWEKCFYRKATSQMKMMYTSFEMFVFNHKLETQ